jgi:hypothetical protein
MFEQDEALAGRPARGPCARIVAAVFGFLFLIALLAVPVTTTTSRFSQEKGSNIITRTSYPRKATMFLPAYLSARARPRQGRTVELLLTQWIATMAIVAGLGVFDYFVFCRLIRRRPRPEDAS